MTLYPANLDTTRAIQLLLDAAVLVATATCRRSRGHDQAALTSINQALAYIDVARSVLSPASTEAHSLEHLL